MPCFRSSGRPIDPTRRQLFPGDRHGNKVRLNREHSNSLPRKALRALFPVFPPFPAVKQIARTLIGRSAPLFSNMRVDWPGPTRRRPVDRMAGQ